MTKAKYLKLLYALKLHNILRSCDERQCCCQ